MEINQATRALAALAQETRLGAFRLLVQAGDEGVSAGALAVDFAFTPPTIYIGAGAGMYYSSDNGTTWTKNNATLPNVNVADLFIDPIARTISAGTYGRGAWMASLPQPCPADFNGDGVVNTQDVLRFLNAWVAGC